MSYGKPLRDQGERARRLEAARQWHIDTKPYFDAIYGPDTVPGRCPLCGEPKRVVTAGDLA